MIVLDGPQSWLGLVLQFHGTILGRIWGRLAFVTAVAAAVTAVHLARGPLGPMLTPTPFTLIGLALSIILGFRNQTCYQRFWEGRQLWGRLVNHSRCFARQVLTLVNPAREGTEEADDLRRFQRELVHRACAYAHLLRLHLRRETGWPQLTHLLPAGEPEALARASNPPAALLHRLGERLTAAWRAGRVDALHLPVLERTLTELTDVQGGCERIKNTPIPFAYTLLIHRIAGMYCLALPFGIVDAVGTFTPAVVLFVSYAFFGLDAIGDEIEDPFGTDDHDLPLLQLSTMIEIDLRERLGETDLPAPIRPVAGVLP